MAILQYPSLATALLDGAINDSVTTITLKSASANWPASGDFWVKIDDEFVKFTGTPSGSVWSGCTRGTDDSTAASHLDEAAVTLVLTEAALDLITASQYQAGAIGSLPADAAGRAGQVYKCTDAPYLFRHNGSVWQAFANGYGPLTRPGLTGAWVNQGSANLVTTHGGLYYVGANDATIAGHLYAYSQPSTPYTVTTMLRGATSGNAYGSGLGLGFRESATNKWISIVFGFTASSRPLQILVQRFSDTSTFSTTRHEVYWPVFQSEAIWLRITNSGSALTFFYSMDGYEFIQAYTEGLTASFTTAPDQYVIGGYEQASAISRAHYLHLQES